MNDRLRKLRREKNLTQSALAEEIGVTRASVNAWESGAGLPNAQCIISLAKFFCTSSDYLLGLDDREVICIDKMTDEEVQIIRTLAKCFSHK